MADSVQIPVEFTGWDKVISSIEGTTKASKELGDQMRKALLGEVIVSSLNRISSGLKDGIAKEAVGAASAVVQGFAQGGPIGAALAGAAVSVGLITKGLQAVADAEREVNAVRLDGYRALSAFERGVGAQQDAFSELNRTRTSAQAAAIVAEEEKKQAAARTAFAARNALAIKFLDEADVALDESFREELDAEAAQAERLREADREGRAARYAEWQQDIRDFDAAQAVERDQQLTLARQAADARLKLEQDAAKQLYDSRMAAQEAVQEMGALAGTGFANQIGSAVGALAQLDAAQIAAAASAEDFGQQMAAGALRATAGVLQGVAQEATAKALLATAKGVGALAGVVTAELAPGFFGEAAAYGAAAVAAGGGAIALNTAASAVAPSAPRAAPSGGGGSGDGGGVTINVNTDRLFSTEADIGASIEHSRKQFERYRGYR